MKRLIEQHYLSSEAQWSNCLVGVTQNSDRLESLWNIYAICLNSPNKAFESNHPISKIGYIVIATDSF